MVLLLWIGLRCISHRTRHYLGGDRLTELLNGRGVGRELGSELVEIVLGRDDLTLARLSEEHGVLTALAQTRLAVGDRLVIIPSHVCTTVNLQPALRLIPVRAERFWLPVDARGWG